MTNVMFGKKVKERLEQMEKRQKELIERLKLPSNIRDHASLITYPKGSYLCKAGKKIQYLQFILSGEVKISMTMANGKTLMRCFNYPGGIVGDLEMMMDADAVNNVLAIKETVCFCIPIKYCKEELYSQISFMEFIAVELAKKLESSSRLSAMNLLYSLENRLSAYIANSSEEGLFSDNLTELAELLGTSYRHLLRTMNDLCEKGVLKKRSRTQYEIIDMNLLKDMAKDCFME